MSAHRRQVVTSSGADADLASIALYGVEAWGVEQTREYLESIADALDLLGEFPYRGRQYGAEGSEVRFIRAGEHVVYYTVEPQVILVIRILHFRMSPSQTLDHDLLE